jgi:hypothetical protein
MKIVLSLAGAFALLGGLITVPVSARSNAGEFKIQTAGYCNADYTDAFTRTMLSPDWVQFRGQYELTGQVLNQIHSTSSYGNAASGFISHSDTDLESQLLEDDFTVSVDISNINLTSTDNGAKFEASLGFMLQTPSPSGTNGAYIGFYKEKLSPDIYLKTYELKGTIAYNTVHEVFPNDGTVKTVKIVRENGTIRLFVNVNGSYVEYGDPITGITGEGFITFNSMTLTNTKTTTSFASFDNLNLACVTVDPEPTEEEKVVYRFFNKKTGSWLYTDSVEEKNAIMLLTTEWSYEGEKFKIVPLNASDITGTIPVYRFFNKCIGGHVFTISETEKQSIQALSCYLYEGEKFRVYDKTSGSGINMYRYFDKLKGYHLFTASESEKSAVDGIVKFSSEGVAFKVISL